MSTNTKQQHFVPKVYLKAWCHQRRKEFICYISPKDKMEWHPHNIESRMKENEMYTIFNEDGTKDRQWETWLHKLETEYQGVREKLEADRELLTPEDFEILARFISAQLHRTPAMRKKVREFLLALGRIYASGGSSPFFFRPGSKFYQPEELKVATANRSSPMTYILLPEINSLFSEIRQMNVSFIEDHTGTGFITSDNPVSVLNGHSKRPAIEEWGINSPRTKIFFPVSPKICALLSWNKIPSQTIGILQDTTLRWNSLTYRHADRWIVSSSKI